MRCSRNGGASPVLAMMAALLCGLASVSRAEPTADALLGRTRGDDAHAYALVVGSNPGGRGQAVLRYAEADARRVAALLNELGGYDRRRIDVLESPSREQLLSHLDSIAVELRRHAAADEPTKLFFYYSGHARAGALNLGSEEVVLSELRSRLLALETTVTVVVLDACQSGAFSSVKGAEPAATFSINSVSRLSARGVAVMASSSALELSQESERLGSSYFTHHLLVGLRGAADIDGDGRVTLDEAYRYGRHRTLIATAATRVGSQHVTLETDLRGKGDLVLSYPARASARLRLPAGVAGEIAIGQLASGNVLAELNKNAGDALVVALPPGLYRVWVRERDWARRCELQLNEAAVTELSLASCAHVPLEATTAKSGRPGERWSFELAFGVGGSQVDALDRRLSDFGFTRATPEASGWSGDGNLRFSLAAGLRVHRHVALVGYFQNLDAGEYVRQEQIAGALRTTTFAFHAYALGVGVRGLLPLLDGLLVPYVQAGVGLGLGFTNYDAAGVEDTSENFIGYQLGAALGLQFMPFRHVGLFAEASYAFAPVIESLLGDTHDSGGHALRLGVRARTWSLR